MDFILQEHDTLDEAIDRIDLLVRRGRYSELQESVQGLMRLLEAHFAHEERSAMFMQLPVVRPEVANEIEALRLEHREMMEEIARIDACFLGASIDESITHLFALMRKLDAHEKVELEIFESTYRANATPSGRSLLP